MAAIYESRSVPETWTRESTQQTWHCTHQLLQAAEALHSGHTRHYLLRKKSDVVEETKNVSLMVVVVVAVVASAVAVASHGP